VVDAKRFVGIGADKSDRPLDDAKKVADEAHSSEAVATGKEAGSTVVTVFLRFEGENSSAD
jgi:hypothetical protein